MFNFLRLPIQYFSAETGGGSGEQTPPEQTGEQKQTDNNQQQGTGDQTPPENSKTFTQDDVNSLVARETKKAQEKFLKDLGIDDFKGAKEGLAKLKEFQESQKTEAEKQAELLKNLETEKGTLSSENATLKAQLSALKAGVKPESTDDVVALAERLVNDETDIDTAIASVVEKYPHFAQEVQQEEETQKPNFLSGQHQKQKQSETDKWLNAFK